MVNERAETSPVCVPADGVMLSGDLGMPAAARGIVLFAHGSGSSRFSQRNRHVAASLRARRFATLLVDLLTVEEEAVDLRTAEIRFDIDLLARRVVGVVDWLGRASSTAGLGIGLFGASTGAAGALVAAAERPDVVQAVVSRGGRPDLAGGALPRVVAPTLLIVGGADTLVIDLNQQAFEDLRCEREIVIVPRATHLFEEPGALDQVADLAGHWFEAHIASQRPPMARAS